jgi:hypothetical protein
MRIEIQGNTIEVRQGTPDEKIRGGTWGTAESAFWRKLRTALNDGAAFFPFFPFTPRWVKTNPQKHGHLTGAEHYLTTHRRDVAIYDPSYAVRCPAEAFNDGRTVLLSILRD